MGRELNLRTEMGRDAKYIKIFINTIYKNCIYNFICMQKSTVFIFITKISHSLITDCTHVIFRVFM